MPTNLHRAHIASLRGGDVPEASIPIIAIEAGTHHTPGIDTTLLRIRACGPMESVMANSRKLHFTEFLLAGHAFEASFRRHAVGEFQSPATGKPKAGRRCPPGNPPLESVRTGAVPRPWTPRALPRAAEHLARRVGGIKRKHPHFLGKLKAQSEIRVGGERKNKENREKEN